MTMDAPDEEFFKNLIGSRFRIRGVAINFSRTRHLLQLSLTTYGMEDKWRLVAEDKPEN